MTKVIKKSPPVTRAQQKLATRQRIRDAAWALFLRDGYAATTTKAVAAKARVAAGTVFVHARDKDDLLCLVMADQIFECVEQAFETLPREAGFIERILHLFRGPVTLYGQHPDVSRAFLRALPGADGPNAQRLGASTFAFLHRMADVIRAAAQRGEVATDIDALLAARSIFALYFSTLNGWVLGYYPIEQVLDPLLRGSLELLMRGLHP